MSTPEQKLAAAVIAQAIKDLFDFGIRAEEEVLKTGELGRLPYQAMDLIAFLDSAESMWHSALAFPFDATVEKFIAANGRIKETKNRSIELTSQQIAALGRLVSESRAIIAAQGDRVA